MDKIMQDKSSLLVFLYLRFPHPIQYQSSLDQQLVRQLLSGDHRQRLLHRCRLHFQRPAILQTAKALTRTPQISTDCFMIFPHWFAPIDCPSLLLLLHKLSLFITALWFIISGNAQDVPSRHFCPLSLLRYHLCATHAGRSYRRELRNFGAWLSIPGCGLWQREQEISRRLEYRH